jgi:hypothetical protein
MKHLNLRINDPVFTADSCLKACMVRRHGFLVFAILETDKLGITRELRTANSEFLILQMLHQEVYSRIRRKAQ